VISFVQIATDFALINEENIETMLKQLADNFTLVWEWLQDRLDISGDVVMLGFTGAVIYKMLYGRLTPSDAAVYASAVTAFAYSNKGPKA